MFPALQMFCPGFQLSFFSTFSWRETILLPWLVGDPVRFLWLPSKARALESGELAQSTFLSVLRTLVRSDMGNRDPRLSDDILTTRRSEKSPRMDQEIVVRIAKSSRLQRLQRTTKEHESTSCHSEAGHVKRKRGSHLATPTQIRIQYREISDLSISCAKAGEERHRCWIESDATT